jgi:hypothetical protein
MTKPDLRDCKVPLTQNLTDCNSPGCPDTIQNQRPDNDVTIDFVNCKPKLQFKTKDTFPKQTDDPVLTSQACNLWASSLDERKIAKMSSTTRSSRHVEQARLALEKAEIMKNKRMLELEVELARVKLE